MKTIAFAIFLGALVLAAGYACGQYMTGGYSIDRMLDLMSRPIVLQGLEGGQQY